MPKRKVELATNEVYHIYNRGVEKNKIFLVQKDYDRFLEKSMIYKNKYGIEIISWSLMPNHFHMAIRQKVDDTYQDYIPVNISKFLQKIQQSHAMYFNKKYKRVGVLFESRFKSKHVKDDSYIIQLVHYIHKQASHHNICIDYEWPYSSLNDFLIKRKINPHRLTEVNTELLDIKNYEKEFSGFKNKKFKSGIDDLF